MEDIRLNIELREGKGSNATRKLREDRIVPAVIYQRGEDNMSVQMLENELDKVIEQAGTSTIITLVLDGKEKKVLIKDYQKHPYKNRYLHVDFQGVRMDETIKVTVPVVLVGRDEISLQPSVLIQNLDEIEVESLPAYIPQTAEVHVKDMEYEESKFVKDLDIFEDENVTILAEDDEVVCTLTEPKEEIIDEDAEEVDAADVEVIGEDDSEDQE